MSMQSKLPASFHSVVQPAFDVLSREQVIERLWSKDHQLWKSDRKQIVERLGWLKVQERMRQQYHRHTVRVELGRDQSASMNAIPAALGVVSFRSRTALKKRRQLTRS